MHSNDAPGTVTEDRLLGGRVVFRQPAQGFRASSDAVFLAASVPAKPGERALDLGAGAGPATLCLAARVADLAIDGLEQDPSLVALAEANAAANGHAERLRFLQGDIGRLPAEIGPGEYHHVFANPPFLPEARSDTPATGAKTQAKIEGEADLAAWVSAALVAARPKGTLTFIHRADRLDDLLAALAAKAGGIVVYPLWPKAGRPAKRVLVRAIKRSRAPLTVAPGLVLHDAGGAWTQEAQAILRDGAALDLAPNPRLT
ncbi:MAG: methyltransferase [Alphaproteobacteria bacterium]|nr:methyltransferase [Alphaproteobacteria bacterium]